jgi:hypothetical protein
MSPSLKTSFKSYCSQFPSIVASAGCSIDYNIKFFWQQWNEKVDWRIRHGVYFGLIFGTSYLIFPGLFTYVPVEAAFTDLRSYGWTLS